jgi:hypothetical protein
MLRSCLLLLLTCACSTLIAFPEEDVFLPAIEPDENWLDNTTIDTFQDTWDDNITAWWEEEDAAREDSNATTAPVNASLSFVDNLLDFFTQAANTTSPHKYLYVTYIELLPVIQCSEIEKVISLFDSRINEANPLSWLKNTAVALAGRTCNATKCECKADHLRRKLATRTLTIETTTSASSLRPVRRFPFKNEMVAVVE